MKFKLPSFELTPPISIIIAGVIIAGAIIFTSQRSSGVVADTNQQGGAVPTAAVNVPVPTDKDNIIGSPSAPIALVEYSDFQCPYCQMIYPTLKKIVSESNGDISWTMREYPLYQIHPQATPSANAALCIAEQLGSAGYFKYADAVFNDQKSLTPEFSATLAKQFGADMGKYNTCVKNSTYQNRIDTESADAQNSGGNGTPYTVIINTKTGKQYPISGALPYAQLVAAIEQVKAGK
jgi:protein-disulfide isomerase